MGNNSSNNDKKMKKGSSHQKSDEAGCGPTSQPYPRAQQPYQSQAQQPYQSQAQQPYQPYPTTGGYYPSGDPSAMGAPPPYSASFQPSSGYPPNPYGGGGYPQGQGVGYPPQSGGYPGAGGGYPSQAPYPYSAQQATYVIGDAFDAGARFDGNSRPNIPPPPPGVMPNAAQQAAMGGHNVVLGQKERKFLQGGSSGGYTFW